MAFPYLGLKQNIYHYCQLACTKIQEELLFFFAYVRAPDKMGY